MSNILGISAFYHDSAAALLVDGEIVAAAQEERFTRKKHDPDFPTQSIAWCLEHTGLRMEQIDYVGFYDKPLLKFERLLETYLAVSPGGFNSFRLAMTEWLGKKLLSRREINQGLGGQPKNRLVFVEHHESHAASAFFPSPFEEAAILTLDGVGEWATGSFGKGVGNHFELTHESHFPHSLGLLYSALTYFCGFRVNSGEYKLMGLAPYGRPTYVESMRDRLLDLKDDGSFRLDMDYFDYHHGLRMTSSRMDDLLGGPPRSPEQQLTQREMDIAASIQVLTEEIVMRTAFHVHERTRQRNLVMAGGVALNCVANGKLLREGPFENIWIQPAAGDAGGALGVALFIQHQLLGYQREPIACDSQRGSLLGPAYDDAAVAQWLEMRSIPFHAFPDEQELCDAAIDLVTEGRVIGWMQGAMEFGPRALGNRSILGDPRDAEMQKRMNLKIKFRESFRPFAPSVLREEVANWFETRPDEESPYMLMVAPVHEQRRVAHSEGILRGLDRLGVARSIVPAITHVDDSARIQTVDAERNPRYHRLLRTFFERTGCPILINTSFNVRGEPIVRTPQDAYRCFMATEMDALIIGGNILLKEEQSKAEQEAFRGYHQDFDLD